MYQDPPVPVPVPVPHRAAAAAPQIPVQLVSSSLDAHPGPTCPRNGTAATMKEMFIMIVCMY
jgi:hypothetical protein